MLTRVGILVDERGGRAWPLPHDGGIEGRAGAQQCGGGALRACQRLHDGGVGCRAASRPCGVDAPRARSMPVAEQHGVMGERRGAAWCGQHARRSGMVEQSQRAPSGPDAVGVVHQAYLFMTF